MAADSALHRRHPGVQMVSPCARWSSPQRCPSLLPSVKNGRRRAYSAATLAERTPPRRNLHNGVFFPIDRVCDTRDGRTGGSVRVVRGTSPGAALKALIDDNAERIRTEFQSWMTVPEASGTTRRPFSTQERCSSCLSIRAVGRFLIEATLRIRRQARIRQGRHNALHG